MAQQKDYRQYQDFAKGEGFDNVAEAVSKLGLHNFKRKFKVQLTRHTPIKDQKITIELKGCRWLVNGKRMEDCSEWEQNFMNRFFQEFKHLNP